MNGCVWDMHESYDNRRTEVCGTKDGSGGCYCNMALIYGWYRDGRGGTNLPPLITPTKICFCIMHGYFYTDEPTRKQRANHSKMCTWPLLWRIHSNSFEGHTVIPRRGGIKLHPPSHVFKNVFRHHRWALVHEWLIWTLFVKEFHR